MKGNGVFIISSIFSLGIGLFSGTVIERRRNNKRINYIGSLVVESTDHTNPKCLYLDLEVDLESLNKLDGVVLRVVHNNLNNTHK